MKHALVAKAAIPVKRSVFAKVRKDYTEPAFRGTRSELSEELRRAWEENPSLETMLARLSEPDMRAAKNDAAIDATVSSLLANKPEDLWIAHRMRKERLGITAKGRPVEVRYIAGNTNRRAIVLAGVHGSEIQGIEVGRIFAAACAGTKPDYSVIYIPALFPDNAAIGLRERAGTATNRNFPKKDEDLAAAIRAGRGRPVDATTSRAGTRGRGILPENQMLIQLIERYKPERIISIHGTRHSGAAGVFHDPITPNENQRKALRGFARLAAFLQIPAEFMTEADADRELRLSEDYDLKRALGRLRRVGPTLALEAAAQIDTQTASVEGREERGFNREGEGRPSGEKLVNRLAHASVPGNVGKSGLLDLPTWSGSGGAGISLGGYGAQRGIDIFTVEPPLNIASSQYPTSADPGLSPFGRAIELRAYAEAIRDILLRLP